MTDILFITPSEHQDLKHESNGTLLLATKLLQAEFSVEILRFWQESNLNKDYTAFLSGMCEKILSVGAKAVCFYTLWPNYHVMLQMAERIKAQAPQMLIVFGGPQASATAQATMEKMPFVDYICTGEGENTVVPFFEAVLRGNGDTTQIPGLFYRKGGDVLTNTADNPLCDLNTLPHWDARLYDYPMNRQKMMSDTYFMPIDAGRGCPYSCSFCCTSHFWRRTYRLKSPERIVEDIRYHMEQFGIRSFWFSHDAFTTNKKLVEQVCDRILELGLDIHWKCTTRIDCIDEALILKMKQAGMTRIEVGVETGSARMQRVINKNLNLDKSVEKIAFIMQQGIRVSLFFMYGFPEETEEDLAMTMDLVFRLIQMGVSHVSMSYCRFNPATQITAEHMHELVLDPEIKVLDRGVFGIDEARPLIAQHRELFPFFYHYRTNLRETYQYLNFLVVLYETFPQSCRGLRSLFGGDDLRLFRHFMACNQDSFDGDMYYAMDRILRHPLQMLEAMADGLQAQCLPQLRAVFRYESDLYTVKKSKEDITIRRSYDFNIMDLRRKRPIEEFTPGKTEILMEKKNGVKYQRILDIM